MKYTFGLTAIVTVFSVTGVTAVAEWGQCGGINYTGSTTCDSPWVCTVINDYYYQCLPGSSSATTVKPTTTTKPTTPTTNSQTTTTNKPTTTTTQASGTQKFKYFGMNESSAEFGNTKWPGVLGTDYTWPSPSSIDYFMGKGFNTFRVCFLMERLSPPSRGLTGSFDATYLSGLTTIVNYITNKGGYALLDPHNFLRYNGGVIGDSTAFATWWKNLATQFKSNSKVVFDLQNEPHDIDATTVYNIMQAAVTSIRGAGATSQLILVEGTSWTGAWTWVSSGNAAAFQHLTDPSNNIAIEMHQYLDSDGSGTADTCVSTTIGAERLQAATAWLKQYGYKGFLGEMGSAGNPTCVSAVRGALQYMQQSGSPWIGFLWWAAGPWWGTYSYSMEPPSGAAIPSMLPVLQSFI